MFEKKLWCCVSALKMYAVGDLQKSQSRSLSPRPSQLNRNLTKCPERYDGCFIWMVRAEWSRISQWGVDDVKHQNL